MGYVVGEQLSRGGVSRLATATPVRHSDLVVLHEEGIGFEKLIHPPGLILKQIEQRPFAETRGDLKAMDDHRVVPAHFQALALGDPRMRRQTNRRARVVKFILSGEWALPQVWVPDRLVVFAFVVDRSILAANDKGTAFAPKHVDQRHLLERQVVNPDRA